MEPLFKVGVAGRIIPVNATAIATDTFLGKADHPDAKDTFVILTDERLYAGPSLDECRRLVKNKQDKSTLYFAGKCNDTVRENLGDLVQGILGQAIFGG